MVCRTGQAARPTGRLRAPVCARTLLSASSLPTRSILLSSKPSMLSEGRSPCEPSSCARSARRTKANASLASTRSSAATSEIPSSSARNQSPSSARSVRLLPRLCYFDRGSLSFRACSLGRIPVRISRPLEERPDQANISKGRYRTSGKAPRCYRERGRILALKGRTSNTQECRNVP